MSLVALSLLSFFVLTATAQSQFPPGPATPSLGEKYQRPDDVASEEQVAQLPDYADPEVAKKLKCSACKCLTTEVYNRLTILSELRHGKPKTFEVIEVLEKMCKMIKSDYGLLMKNNKPTTDFSRNPAISRLSDGWINTFLENRCNEMLSDHDEDIVSSYQGRLAAFQAFICREKSNACSLHQLNKQEL